MNYYEILGVEKTATKEEINEAYRKKARQYHPDLNRDDPNAAEKFKEVSAAFEVLNNPDKRLQYDRGGTGIPFGMPPGFNPFGAVDVGDLFGHAPMFRERGLDINIALSITLEESYKGCVKNVKIKTKDKCNCESSCASCGGKGQVVSMQHGWSISMGCGHCKGTGKSSKPDCDKCRGTGYSGDKEEVVKVEIPAGVDNSMEVRLAGQGTVGSSGRRGNLHVSINVKPHEFFSRNQLNLICTIPVSYTQLMVGDKVSIPTPDGSVDVTIPPRTEPNKKIRLKGLGFPNLQGLGQGDMLVAFELDMPKSMPDELLKSIKEWEEETVSDKRKKFYQ